MKKLITLVLGVFTTLLAVAQPNPKNDYQIDVTLKPFTNEWIYLAHYFTNQTKYLVDSALLDKNSKATFKGNNESINGGVYLVIFPGKYSYLEFIIDNNKKIAIEIDTTHIKDVKFINSPENDNFSAYQQFVSDTRDKYQKSADKIRSATKIDSVALRQNATDESQTLAIYKKDYVKNRPHDFLSTLFLVMDGPQIPKLPNASDSFQYFINHYWDNLSFSDPRILRTPILEQKFNNYINNFIPNNIDSMTNVAYRILAEAKKDSLAYRYYLSKLAIQYGNSMIPVQADAFYYIFTKYIENQKPSWVSDELYAQMQRRANLIAGNIIGNQAYDIALLDTTNKKFNLYGIKSKYTLLCFWDPICGHCLQVMPLLDSFYQNNWKKKDVTMVGIYVDGGIGNWKKYIANHDKEWLHGYETDSMRNALYAQQKPNYRQLYNIMETPTIYLLDKDKKILLKQINPMQVNAYLEYFEKVTTNITNKKEITPSTTKQPKNAMPANKK